MSKSNLAFNELSKRVDSLQEQITLLQSLDYKFYLPLIISILSILVSIFIGWYSKKGFDKQHQDNTLQGIKTDINLAKTQLLSVSNKSDTDEISAQKFNASIEHLLNAYEDGCLKFFTNKVIKKDFSDMFHHEIQQHVEENEEKFGNTTNFTNMLKYYKEHIKQVNIS